MDTALTELPIIDREAGLKLAGNNQELANDLLALLIKNLRTDIASIQTAYTNNHQDELKKQVHKLRGGVAYCGLPRLKNVLIAIETSLKNEKPQDVHDLLNQLNNETTILLSHYNQQT